MANIYDWIEEVRSETLELNDTALHNEDMVIYFNKGLKDVLSLTGRRMEKLLYKDVLYDVVAGSLSYTLPKDCLADKVEEVSFLYNEDWYRLEERLIVDRYDFINEDSTDLCEYYILFGDTIEIYPTPSKSVTEGLKLTYIENLKKFSYPFGTVKKIVDTTKLYLDNFSIQDTDGNIILSVNDYITITNNATKETTYSYRIKSIDETEGYLEVFSSMTALSVSAVSQSSKSFTFTGEDLSIVLPGDTLTISGSTGNDGDYSIIGIDTANCIVYVKDTIASAVADGTGVITAPTIKNELTIYTDLTDLNYGDVVCKFNTTAAVRLPEIFEDYIIQYAVIKCLKRAKEPIEEELLELKRLAQEIEASPSNRRASQRFQVRDTNQ